MFTYAAKNFSAASDLKAATTALVSKGVQATYENDAMTTTATLTEIQAAVRELVLKGDDHYFAAV
jgi:hypothetical protein